MCASVSSVTLIFFFLFFLKKLFLNCLLVVCFVHHSILTMPRPAKTVSAPFTLSTPPPPSPTSAPAFTAVSSVPCYVSGATSCVGISSSAVSSGPGHGVSRSTTSAAPAMVDQNPQIDLFRGFLAYMDSQKLVSSAVSSLASVQSNTRLVYTAAPSDRPFSAVGLPLGPSPLSAPVRGSGSGRGWGQQGRPLFPSSSRSR